MRLVPKIRRRLAIGAGACLLTASAFALVGAGKSDPEPVATVTGTRSPGGGQSPPPQATRAATASTAAPVGLPVRPSGTAPRLVAERTLIVEPSMPQPGGRPCEVELFSDSRFSDFVFYEYTPPAACPGPWAKVVLRMELSGPRRTHPPHRSARGWTACCCTRVRRRSMKASRSGAWSET